MQLRTILTVLFALVVIPVIISSVPADAQEASAMPLSVVITPAAGLTDQVFSVSGAGFPAGTSLAVRLLAPDGSTITLTRDEQPVVLTAAEDGSVLLDLLPVRDLVSPTPGAWAIQLCSVGAEACWMEIFEIWPQYME